MFYIFWYKYLNCNDILLSDVVRLILELQRDIFYFWYHTLNTLLIMSFQMYSLDNLIVPLGFPLLQKHFASWRPLSEQHYGLDVVRLWKEVLDEKQPVNYGMEQQAGQKR